MGEPKSYFTDTGDDDPFASLGKGNPLAPPPVPQPTPSPSAVLEVSSAMDSFVLEPSSGRGLSSRGHSRNASTSSVGAFQPPCDVSHSNTPPLVTGPQYNTAAPSYLRQSPSVPTLDSSTSTFRAHSRQSSLTGGSLPGSVGHSRNASVGSVGSMDFTGCQPPSSLPIVPPPFSGQEPMASGQARRGRPYVVPPSLNKDSPAPGFLPHSQSPFSPPSVMRSNENLLNMAAVDPIFLGNAPPQANAFTAPPVVPGYHQPLQHHWFFRKEVEGKTVWSAFSYKDSARIDESYLRGVSGLDTNDVVPVCGGRYDVHVSKRIRCSVYWEEEPVAIRRCGWFYKAPLESKFLPYDETLSAVIEEEYRVSCVTNQWHRQVDLRNGETVNFHSATTVLQFPSKTAGFFPSPPTGDYSTMPSPDYQTDVQNIQCRTHNGKFYYDVENLNLNTNAAFQWPAANSIQPLLLKRSVAECSYVIPEDESEVVDHLVFLVHGIGSVCDLRFRPVGEVVDSFRERSTHLMSSHFGDSVKAGRAHRVEYLPVNWHQPLHGDETGIDKRLKPITLASIPKLRFFANDTVLDVLLYTSPVYCETIVATIVQELNRMYDLFKRRNPGFAGGVSLGGHSLGALILFDILSHQTPNKEEKGSDGTEPNLTPEIPDPFPASTPLDDPSIELICKQLNLDGFLPTFEKEKMDYRTLLLCGDTELKELGLSIGERVRLKTFLRDIHGRRLKNRGNVDNEVHTSSVGYNVSLQGTGQPSIEYPTIDFQPSNFFAMGSPVAMFVSVRGIDKLGVDFKLPTCPKVFNIFHPYDPIAYRMESLIDPHLSSLPPVLIPHHKGRKRMHRELKETVTKFSADIKQKFWDGLKTTWATVQTYTNMAQIPALGGLVAGSEVSQSTENLHQDSPSSTGGETIFSETAGEAFAEFRGSDDPSVLQVAVGSLNGGRRIDYVLQEAPFESVNEYIFAMASHVCYWQSQDTILLILKEIYSDMGVHLDVPVQQNQVAQPARFAAPGGAYSPVQSGFISDQMYNQTQPSEFSNGPVPQSMQGPPQSQLPQYSQMPPQAQVPQHMPPPGQVPLNGYVPFAPSPAVPGGFVPPVPMGQPASPAGSSSNVPRARRYVSALNPVMPQNAAEITDPMAPPPVSGYVPFR